MKTLQQSDRPVRESTKIAVERAINLSKERSARWDDGGDFSVKKDRPHSETQGRDIHFNAPKCQLD